MPERLKEIVKSLKAHTAIIIENAFQYETREQNIVAKFCFSSKRTRDKILVGLNNSNRKNLASLFTEFHTQFQKSNRDKDLERSMPAHEYFHFYLEKINSELLKSHHIFEAIKNLQESDENGSFNELLLRYGIYRTDEAGYNEIISTLQEIENQEILIYKNHPANSELDNFIEEIHQSCTSTGSHFYLALIDKKLGSASADESGKLFIEHDLIPKNEERKLKFACCLYTSDPNNDESTNEYINYFIKQIGKNASNKIDLIIDALSTSAYIEVFKSIEKNKIESASKAFNLVIKNQKNIKYIIDKSHDEGISAYEAIKYWYDLASSQSFENNELENFKVISGLTSLFKDKYLENNPNIGKIGDTLVDLNSFELFDYNINKKHLSIAPGDIWRSDDGSYYILIGQLCDLLLRKNNSRKAKIGELFKIRLENLNYGDKNDKYFIKTDDGKKFIIIKNFKIDLHPSSYKSIVIDISTPNIEFSNLSILDLAMFNEFGICSVDITSELQNDIIRVLPENKHEYYNLLCQNLKKINEIAIEKNVDFNTLKDDTIKFSNLCYSFKDNLLNFGLTRVARLKGRYYDSLYNNYLNNKGRIDLNLIDNSPDQVSQIAIRISLPNENNEHFTINNVNLWTNKTTEFVERSSLLKIPSDYEELLSLMDEKIKTGTHPQYELIASQEESIYNLNLKYKIDNNYHGKSSFAYSHLFGKRTGDYKYKVEGDNNEYSFLLSGDDRPKHSIGLMEIKKGISLESLKEKVILVNGILIRTVYE